MRHARSGWRVVGLVLAMAAFPAVAGDEGDESLKEAWTRVGHSVRGVTRDVGHATRDLTREVGHASRDVAKATGKSAKQAGREVDNATREPRQDAAESGQGLWAQTKQGVADALDSLAEALRGLSDEDESD
jgi:hypothetical protein